MALVPEQRIENVRGSLMSYLATNYTLTSIAFPRTAFAEENVNEWIKPDIIVATKDYKGPVAASRRGAIVTLLFNISIIVKKAFIEGGDSFRIELIRDTLHELFKEETNIQVDDKVGGGGAIGTLQCFDIDETDLGLDETKGVYVYNFTPTLFWVEART